MHESARVLHQSHVDVHRVIANVLAYALAPVLEVMTVIRRQKNRPHAHRILSEG